MNIKHCDYIFVDLGSTLIDEDECHLNRAQRIVEHYRERGQTPKFSAEEFIKACYATGSVQSGYVFQSTLEKFGLSKTELEELKPLFRYNHVGEKLYPGAEQALKLLSSRCPLGVIANQSLGTEQRLRAYGIRDYFQLVFASAEEGLSKPDPRVFEIVQQRIGVAPDRICMIGDRMDNDIAPAKAAGWSTIRILQGFYKGLKPTRVEETADLTLESFADVPNHLAR